LESAKVKERFPEVSSRQERTLVSQIQNDQRCYLEGICGPSITLNQIESKWYPIIKRKLRGGNMIAVLTLRHQSPLAAPQGDSR